MNIKPLGDPFSGLVTPEDIARIEEAVNFLVCHLVPPGEEREEALAMPLSDKILGFIRIADRAANDPEIENGPEYGPEVGRGLRELLKDVSAYYHKLN